MKNYYHILGVSPDASDSEIRTAYRCLVKKFHPDLPKTPDSKRFLDIQAAYETLSDANKRKTYDDQLRCASSWRKIPVEPLRDEGTVHPRHHVRADPIQDVPPHFEEFLSYILGGQRTPSRGLRFEDEISFHPFNDFIDLEEERVRRMIKEFTALFRRRWWIY